METISLFQFLLVLITENYTYTESSGRVTLTEDDNKIPNAVIIVDNIVLEDRGNFTCIAKNMATKYAKYQPAESTTFVRVKGLYFITYYTNNHFLISK